MAAKENCFESLKDLQKVTLENPYFTSRIDIAKVLGNLFGKNENSQRTYNSQNATLEKLKIAENKLGEILPRRDIPFNYKQKMQLIFQELQIQTAKVEQNQELIKQMESWAESEFEKVENTNMLIFGEEKDGKREIIGGSGKNIINPGESSFDYKDPTYLQQKLRDNGFKIYQLKIDGKAKFEVRHIDNLENNNSKKIEPEVELTESQSDLTNSQRAEMAENN